MTWLATALHDGGRAVSGGGAIAARGAMQPFQAVGSLVLEADLGSAPRVEQTLLLLKSPQRGGAHLSFHIGADGSLTFARRLGEYRRQVTLKSSTANPEQTIRVTLSWDTTRCFGMITLEIVSEGLLVQKEFSNPAPLLQEEVSLLCAGGAGAIMGAALRAVHLSDKVEPVGPGLCFTADTPIRTPQGFVPVQSLKSGDRIVTASGQTRPVLWAGQRTVPAEGRFRPIRLHAPYFGLLTDVIVGPEARLMIEGPEVEYLFNDEKVLVEVNDLINDSFAIPLSPLKTISYFQLLLDEHDVLDVAGAAMESLFVGNLGEAPEIWATTAISGLPAGRAPRHQRLVCRALRNYEALTLRAALLSR